jgi:hypothetical protein
MSVARARIKKQTKKHAEHTAESKERISNAMQAQATALSAYRMTSSEINRASCDQLTGSGLFHRRAASAPSSDNMAAAATSAPDHSPTISRP